MTFLLGLIVGGFVGVLVMSLAVMAGRSSKYLDETGDALAQRLRDEAGA